MRVARLWLNDFRNYTSVEVPFGPGLTVLVGSNGAGKTNLLEALGYLATLSSFRGAPGEALVRDGCAAAIVRAEALRQERSVLIEAELRTVGRDRVLVNRQPLRRSRDLLGALRVTVFAPDDLAVVKGGPAGRRRFVDEVLVALHPKWDGLQRDVDRVLRQRNTLLRQAGGRLTPEVASTLDVWDAKLGELGEALAKSRRQLLCDLEPEIGKAYDQVSAASADIGASYGQAWEGDLLEALARSRKDDLRRGVTLIGPHRDDVVLTIGGLPARSHASQGEQRSMALALKLAAHRFVSDAVEEAPVLLLDDVFSELDAVRARALLLALPAGQTVLTTAGPVPEDAAPDAVLRVGDGEVRPA
ncbi:MAG TPA: DNA replication/repair protein RecF [Acidimicrobiales bacterium]|nr:DNA replication/repair protein RecF [Acidimicrobiales bacterium]